MRRCETVERVICRARSKDFLACYKSPRQSFAACRRQNQLQSQNSGDRCLGILTAQPASVCAVWEPIQSMLWMGEETQGSKAPLLPMGRSEAVRTLRRRATQRAASPRKNACIFEKRVEVSRHADSAAYDSMRRCVFVCRHCRHWAGQHMKRRLWGKMKQHGKSRFTRI